MLVSGTEQQIYFELVYFVTKLEPSDTECFVNSPGNGSYRLNFSAGDGRTGQTRIHGDDPLENVKVDLFQHC
jgi:hypothetical protein